MSSEPNLRPFGAVEPEPMGGTPHISDYWQVVTRRLGLVLVAFTATTAAAIWAVSRQDTLYQGTMTLQVSDPLERQRGLVGTRVSGMDIFVDPIESEIQVLRSSSIASEVVESTGLRLARVPLDERRSELFHDAWVSPDAPEGQLRLEYDASGGTATLRSPDGDALATSPVGEMLDAVSVGFVVQAPPSETRRFALEIVPASVARSEIAFAAAPRANTNIIDVTLIHTDPHLIPVALNAAGRALREKGAEQVRGSARADIEFIDQRLTAAREQLTRSMEAIRDFKKSQEFTNLSERERSLLDRSGSIADDMDGWEGQRTILVELVTSLAQESPVARDWSSVLAQLPEGSAPEVRSIIEAVQEEQAEERRLLVEDRKSEVHPEVVAVRSEIRTLVDHLYEATWASLQLVDSQLSVLGSEHSALLDEQREFPDLEGELQALEAQRTLDREAYQFLLSQLYQAQITEAAAAPYVEVLDPAGFAAEVGGRRQINILLGALLGLILGIGAAFFLEYLDRTVRTSADAESLLGVPVLGVIPMLRRLDEIPEEAVDPVMRNLPLMVAMDPLDPAAEAYRSLRLNLTFVGTEDRPVRSILFSSPGPSEGKSTTAINFAVMLAQQGQRVLVIDADLRRPSLHMCLDVLREPGLTNLLVGDATTRESVRPNVLPNLDFLPSGPFPPNPSELLNSKAMARLLEEFEGRYDQIVIDSPPVLAVTDASVLAVHTDGVVLVLRSGETEQRAAERSVDQLRRLGARVFGAVLNEVSPSSPDDSYYMQYYYSYRPSGKGGGLHRLREGLSKVRFFA